MIAYTVGEAILVGFFSKVKFPVSLLTPQMSYKMSPDFFFPFFICLQDALTGASNVCGVL